MLTLDLPPFFQKLCWPLIYVITLFFYRKNGHVDQRSTYVDQRSIHFLWRRSNVTTFHGRWWPLIYVKRLLSQPLKLGRQNLGWLKSPYFRFLWGSKQLWGKCSSPCHVHLGMRFGSGGNAYSFKCLRLHKANLLFRQNISFIKHFK